jgi:hypothetical protein
MSVGGLMEKKEEHPMEGEKTFCKAKQAKSANLPECTVSGGLWEEWKEESGKTFIEVIEAIKTQQV